MFQTCVWSFGEFFFQLKYNYLFEQLVWLTEVVFGIRESVPNFEEAMYFVLEG